METLIYEIKAQNNEKHNLIMKSCQKNGPFLKFCTIKTPTGNGKNEIELPSLNSLSEVVRCR